MKSKWVYNEVENGTLLKHTSTASLQPQIAKVWGGKDEKEMQKQEAKIFKGIIKDKKIKDVV